MESQNALKQLRAELGCTQDELAAMLGVGRATIARYESETGTLPQGDNAKKIAQLQSFIKNDKKEIVETFKEGGPAAIAGILAVGAAQGLGAGASIAAIAALPAFSVIAALGGAMVGFKKFLNESKKED